MHTPDSEPPSIPETTRMCRAALQTSSVLALDVGDARIGVATKPAGQQLVLPLGIVYAQPEERAVERLRSMIRERGVEIMVIGLPVHPDSTQTRKIKRFTRRLREGMSGVRWRFQDERLTSEAAEDIGHLLDKGAKGRPNDDRAAALILEDFIASLPET